MENINNQLNDETNQENINSGLEKNEKNSDEEEINQEKVNSDIEEMNKTENLPEVDEDLEFLKAQIRQRNKLQNQKKEDEEDYSYIKRFKINSYIETVLGIIAIIIGLLTKNYLTDCLGIALLCFGYLFRNIAKRGEYKRDKEK